MKTICQNTLKQILNYDPITGIFTWVKKISDVARIYVNKKHKFLGALSTFEEANIQYNFHQNHGA